MELELYCTGDCPIVLATANYYCAPQDQIDGIIDGIFDGEYMDIALSSCDSL